MAQEIELRERALHEHERFAIRGLNAKVLGDVARRQALILEKIASKQGATTLSQSIPAIEMLPTEEGKRPRLGLIVQLPKGATIETAGPGFSARTVYIQCSGASYFVFLEDLEVALQLSTLNDEGPGLRDLIKTKFVGYFRWTAFVMLLAPIVFWIASRQ